MNADKENSLISGLLKREVISINENKPLYNAIKILAKYNIGALPVLNSNNMLCGIISERDILQQLSQDVGISDKFNYDI